LYFLDWTIVDRDFYVLPSTVPFPLVAVDALTEPVVEDEGEDEANTVGDDEWSYSEEAQAYSDAQRRRHRQYLTRPCNVHKKTFCNFRGCFGAYQLTLNQLWWLTRPEQRGTLQEFKARWTASSTQKNKSFDNRITTGKHPLCLRSRHVCVCVQIRNTLHQH
jgi:hypothetical protein